MIRALLLALLALSACGTDVTLEGRPECRLAGYVDGKPQYTCVKDAHVCTVTVDEAAQTSEEECAQ